MRFGEYELDLSRFELRRSGQRVRVQPKVLDLLAYLIRNRERVVTKDELLAALWEGVVVSETALTQTVKEARRAVRDDGERQRVIQTVRGRGYRFALELEEESDAEGPGAAATTFVGREALLALLEQQFALARAGRGQTVFLTGEPGIGKSRTTLEFLASARRQGARALLGRCVEGPGTPAHWVWTQIVRDALGRGYLDPARDLAGADTAVLARALPDLRADLGVGDAGADELGASDEQLRFRLSDSLARLVLAAATRAPLVLVLDDLHWADHSSLHLLEFVARELREARVLLIGTYRETELSRDPARARQLGAVARAEGAHGAVLEGLDTAEVARLFELTTGSGIPAPVAEALHDRTGGNPFFLTQLVHLWEASGGDVEDLRRELPLPHGVREAIARHLDGLPEAARDLLSRASVIGRGFELDVLAAVSGMGVDATLETLDAAVEARVVRPAAESWASFEFVHALIPETLYEAMSPARRLRLHGRVGHALESLRGSDDGRVAEMAWHFAQAAPVGEMENALRYGERAGELATRQLAYQEAVLHYRRCLDLVGFTAAGAPQRLRLLLALGEAEARAGETAEARLTFQRAAGLARERGDAEALARAALGIDWNIVREGAVGTDAVRLALLGEALGAVGPQETSLRVRLLAALDEALYFEDDRPPDAPSLSATAVEMARRIGDADALVFALNRRHLLLRRPDRLDERLAVSTELVHLARQRRDPDLVFDAHGSQIHDALERGEIRPVDEALETFERLSREYKIPKYLWYAELYRAMRDLLAGRYAEAEPRIESAFATGLRVQPDLARVWHVAQMETLRVDQGRAGEFLPELREVVQAYPLLPVRLLLALAEAITGYTGPAKHIVRETLPGLGDIRRDISWVLNLSVLGELCEVIQDVEGAARVYEQLLPFAEQHVVVGTAIVYRGCVATDLGRLAAVCGRFDAAADHFALALERERRMGARPFEAWVQCCWAAMLLARGGAAARTEAEARLAEAGALVEELGAGFHRSRVEELRRLAGA